MNGKKVKKRDITEHTNIEKELKQSRETSLVEHARDTSNRKLTEQAEKKYTTIIQTALDGFWITDLKGQFLDVNDSYCQMIGYSREELLTMAIPDLEASEKREETAQHIKKIIEQGYDRFETHHKCKDGKNINLEINAKYSYLGGGQLIAFIRDITEQKRAVKEFDAERNEAQEELQKAHDELETEVEEGTQALQMSQAKVEEGTQALQMSQAKVEEGTQALRMSQAKVEEGTQALRMSQAKVEEGTQALRMSQAKVEEGTQALRMSQAKVEEREESIEAQNQAEGTLKETLNNLARSNSELQQFAYVASHDLQEPLRMVTSYMQLLERRYKDKLDNDAKEFIAYAVDGAIRMKTLINDLLQYSRIETRANPFELTDIENMLKQTISNLEMAIKENNAVITHDALPHVIADSTQMVQLLQNLIENGIKFHSDKPPQIHIGAKQNENEWEFSVRDNGIGIDPQYFNRLFLIFQRLHSRDEYPGNGIGLAVCKRIIVRHGGKIWVESKVGEGSTFYFTIPIPLGESNKEAQ